MGGSLLTTIRDLAPPARPRAPRAGAGGRGAAGGGGAGGGRPDPRRGRGARRWKVLPAARRSRARSSARGVPLVERERRRARGPGRHRAAAGRRGGGRAARVALEDMRPAPGRSVAGAGRGAGPRQRGHHPADRARARRRRAWWRSRARPTCTTPRCCAAAWARCSGCPRWPPTPDALLAWATAPGVETWVTAADGEPLERGRRRGAEPRSRWSWATRARGSAPRCRRRRSRRVAIPLGPGVESLNVAVAAGILLYEVTRDV